MSAFFQPIELHSVLQKLVVAILIGLLIGLEREHNKPKEELVFGGVRTYTLISIYGFLSAFIAVNTVYYLYIVFSVSIVILVSLSFYFGFKKGFIGGTTEITAMLVFVLGSMIYWDFILISVITAVIVTVFLSLKKELHSFAGRIDSQDIFATLKFCIVTLIILPILPDKEFGPLKILNPHHIWYMVVLIAGISFVGYLLFKVIGTKRGIQLLSIMGGLASSTATTLSFTERSREAPMLSKNFAAAIIIASTIMFPRVLLIIYILNAELGKGLFVPVAIIATVGVITSIIMWRSTEKTQIESIKINNPFKIFTAIKFGIIFAVILFVSKASLVFFGNAGIYFTSLIGGFADVDAVALSIAQLAGNNLSGALAVRLIIIAMLSNTVVKALITVFLGCSDLKKYTIVGFLPMIIAGLLYIVVSALI